MLTAVEYLGNVGIGVTTPHFFRANDEKIYVVKLQNNKLGPKVLVNELIAAKIGHCIGLCFPTSDIIMVNQQSLENSRCPTVPHIILGRQFASQYLEHTEYIEKHNVVNVINITDMAGVILFDHMFHNADRANNKKNIFIRQEDNGCRIYAIDHSHLFRSGRWTIDSLTNLMPRIKSYCHYSFGLLLRDYLSPKDFFPYLEKLAECSNENIEQIVTDIPSEWLPDESERQALVTYIKMRFDMAESIWKFLCNYIPKSRGGYRYLY